MAKPDITSPAFVADQFYNDLIILVDRYRCFQDPPYGTPNSALALKHLRVAQRAMHRDFLKREGMTAREHARRLRVFNERLKRDPAFASWVVNR